MLFAVLLLLLFSPLCLLALFPLGSRSVVCGLVKKRATLEAGGKKGRGADGREGRWMGRKEGGREGGREGERGREGEGKRSGEGEEEEEEEES